MSDSAVVEVCNGLVFVDISPLECSFCRELESLHFAHGQLSRNHANGNSLCAPREISTFKKLGLMFDEESVSCVKVLNQFIYRLVVPCTHSTGSKNQNASF